MGRLRPLFVLLVLLAGAAAPAEAALLPPLLGPAPERADPRPPPPRPGEPRPSGCISVAGPARPALPLFSCDFPDPMVLRVGGSYYAYGSLAIWRGSQRTFPILRSSDLRRWRPVGNGFRSPPAWTRGHLWAPHVLRVRRGRYLMYYSARRWDRKDHCVAVAESARPWGPFRHRRILACRDSRAAGYIDAAPLRVGRRAYLFFSVDGPRHSISALRLGRDLVSVRGRRRALLGVTEPWQMGLRKATVEAPAPMKRGKRFYLFHSAGCWCSDYRMGYAVARSPMGPYRYPPRNPLIAHGHAGLSAPGSGTPFRDRRGRTWMAFHAWSGPTDYKRHGVRTLRLGRVSWTPPKRRARARLRLPLISPSSSASR